MEATIVQVKSLTTLHPKHTLSLLMGLTHQIHLPKNLIQAFVNGSDDRCFLSRHGSGNPAMRPASGTKNSNKTCAFPPLSCLRRLFANFKLGP